MENANTYYVQAKFENAKTAFEKIRKFKLLCSISMINDEVIEKAITSDFKDSEDAMHYLSAMDSDCDDMKRILKML